MQNMPPDPSLPRIWCDFNACGWSGEPDDNCFYALDEAAILALWPAGGARVFVCDDGDDQVLGCVGHLEPYRDGWRVRPCEDTWFRGQLGEAGRA